MMQKNTKVFLTSANNKPSGGGKVLNQVSNLFRVKGYDSYLALPGTPEKALWLDSPSEVISLEDMIKKCDKNDIVIDGWQKKEIYKATMRCSATVKVFWSHGASIPIGNDYVGEKAFLKNSGYTHQWNVSKVCKNYIEEKYNLKNIDIIHPFFDDNLMKKFLIQKRKFNSNRKGILCLARRGSTLIPSIVKKFCPKNKISVIHGNFSTFELYDSLLRHRYFVSLDNGISDRNLKVKTIIYLKTFFSKDKNLRNFWLVPKGNILGFPMSACEAAWLGGIVIGFPMGGGLEWMNKNNCFIAEDRDLDSLIDAIERALNSDEKTLNKISENAYDSVKRFNKENTWKEIANSLEIDV